MIGYVVVDSFTSNLEDYVFQITNMDPLNLLFGMETISGLIALLLVVVGQELQHAVAFMWENHEVIPYVALLAMTSASGFYTPPSQCGCSAQQSSRCSWSLGRCLAWSSPCT